MKLARISALLLAMVFLLQGLCFSDTKEEFPKIGFAKNSGSNVRAGDNINFESLCKLRKGDPVKIIDERYSWFNIMLPKMAHVYIKNDFVDADLDENSGEVNAARVNLRAGPDTKYSIIGQVSKPQELRIVSEIDGWYEIEPPEEIAGWIHASQVSFKFVDMDEIGEEKEEKEIEAEERMEIKKAPLALKTRKGESVKLMLKEPPKTKGNLVFSTQAD